MRKVVASALVWSMLLVGWAHGEEQVLRDIAYDDQHESQKLDVYLADTQEPAPVMVFIHGGGWEAGSKADVPYFLRKANNEGWLAVVSVEYRFTNVAVHPAQVDDCARAIQYVRQHAEEWNIAPHRIGVTGGSAGGHLTAYMALQDDEANPDSDDPVARQSSRVAFAIPFAGPTDWGLLSKIEHTHPGYFRLLGVAPGTPADQLEAERVKDVSPASFASDDDPPMLIVHGDADKIVPFEHAAVLEAALEKAEVEVELYVVKGGSHGVAGAGGEGGERAEAYMREKFGHAEPAPSKEAEVAQP
ncbi:alpha/beta hydrolase [Aeoliella mucimassa]|uniref:Carboxylesterase NlhH n=1 Tax=Aeoliella mucimassa TaxID=2527972 RepID=A0A518AJU4_9BACT|nr:alpha/beta hydrolase [Aeoliella mucimassa]QDU55017.1 Carboxylesterase NlhH [Aeoliella mucimassa]